MSRYLLSKSTFIRSLQCQKSLYLYKRFPELRDRISAEQQAVFDRGHQVGFLARQLFPGGVDVGWKSPTQYNRSVKLTQKHIEAGTRVIYEASFLWDNVLVAVDILVREEDGWHAYEVKSSTQVSETYLRDAALQNLVIEGSGLPLTGFSIVHLNKDYVRKEHVDLKELFAIRDVKIACGVRRPYVLEGLNRARMTLRSAHAPDVEIGPHCTSPYPCDFRNHCWKHIDSDSIFSLSEMEDERKWILFGRGIMYLQDIPEEFPLTRMQRIQRDGLLYGEVHIDRKEIHQMLGGVKYPAAFLDLNTCRPGVPLLPGGKPYGNLIFGYALHRYPHLCADGQEEAYLAEAGPHVQKHVLERFLQDTEGIRQLLVFNKTWELKALRELGKLYPEHKKALDQRLKLVTDIAEVFQKRYFSHPGMRMGDAPESLLPALGLEPVRPAEEPPLKSAYMAGIGFEQLFREHNFMNILDIRRQLINYMLRQADAIWAIYKFLREEGLAGAPPESTLVQEGEEDVPVVGEE